MTQLHTTKIKHLSDFTDLDPEVFVLWFSNCRKRTDLTRWNRKTVTDNTVTGAMQIPAKDSLQSVFISRRLICLSPVRQVKVFSL